MAILGKVIKTAIELKQTLTPEMKDAREAQETQLRNLLEKAKNTAFGTYYGFSTILDSEDLIATYQEKVPLHDYDKINERWWQQQQIESDITWPGKPDFFALSSGTTGKTSKRIPVTKEMLASFRSVGISQAECLANYDLPADVFEKDILMLSSSADLARHNGHLEGEISGINTSNLPAWFNGFYKPGLEIAQIDDWDERVSAIAEAAPEWDVVAIAGIPSWVKMMLETIIRRHQLKNIHELWPNLSIYASGGVAFEPYRSSLEKLLARPLIYMDTYLASEGFFAFTARPDTLQMKMALDHGIFYEFIPFDETGFDETGELLDNPKICTISEVEEGKDYALSVSTPAGAWRYMIGDTVKFKDLESFEFVISGRTKYFLNVVGAQLSEEKINQAMKSLAEAFDLPINEFAVAAVQNNQEEYIHQWVIGAEGNADENQLKSKLDEILQSLNKNYAVARKKALKDIKVKLVTTQEMYHWLETRKKKGGQIKMPKVMKAEMMEDLLAFLD